MTIQTSTLRPGFLVSLKTSLRGNVHYVRTNLSPEGEQQQEGVDRWETVRTISDPQEHKAAKSARSKAAGLIRRACSQSAFGLLCPEVDAEKLEAAIAEARKVIDAFNDGAKLSRVAIFVLTGRVMPDDAAAVAAINSEIRELLEDMSAGIGNGNVDMIREAASRVKGIGEMLSTDAQTKVEMAVKTARDAAKSIVRDREREGSEGVVQVDKSAIKRINELRTAFLDLDDAQEVGAAKTASVAQLDLAS